MRLGLVLALTVGIALFALCHPLDGTEAACAPRGLSPPLFEDPAGLCSAHSYPSEVQPDAEVLCAHELGLRAHVHTQLRHAAPRWAYRLPRSRGRCRHRHLTTSVLDDDEADPREGSPPWGGQHLEEQDRGAVSAVAQSPCTCSPPLVIRLSGGASAVMIPTHHVNLGAHPLELLDRVSRPETRRLAGNQCRPLDRTS